MLAIGDILFIPMFGPSGIWGIFARVERVTTEGVNIRNGEMVEWVANDYLITIGARKILTDEIKKGDSQRS